MSTLVLGNPLGLWALLAIPIVLAIHFLQPRSRRLVATTMFLLEHLPPQATTGRTWRWLRSTWALWLQILAVLLITWLLAEPRWLRRDSLQTIVVLLDASASMRAFRAEAFAALQARAPTWERTAARTEWIIRETHPGRPVLYRGFTRATALAALERWQPDLGSHDFAPTLDIARQLVRRNGAAVLLTDRRPAVKLDGVALLAVGRAIENAGFAGGSVNLVKEGRPRWTVLVQHHGTRPASRKLETAIRPLDTQVGGSATAEAAVRREEITLEPGRLMTLAGEFPEGVEALEFRLTADAFDLDDTLPLVVPVPRPLTWRTVGPETGTAFFRRFIERTPGTTRAASGAAPDISIYATNTPFNQPVSGANLIELMIYTIHPAGSTNERVVTAPVVADLHPWIDGVTWSGLLGPGPAANLLPPGARALLWQGEQPLAWLEAVQGAPRLVFGWNWPASNAERLPASAVLLHRVIEDARGRKFASETRNVDAGQRLDLPHEPGALSPTTSEVKPARWTWRRENGETRTIDPEDLATLRAPATPGFFEVRRDDQPMLHAAAQFADPRETDFTTAETFSEPDDLSLDVMQANSDDDHLRPLWLLLLLGVLLGSWAVQVPRRQTEVRS